MRRENGLTMVFHEDWKRESEKKKNVRERKKQRAKLGWVRPSTERTRQIKRKKIGKN